MVDRGHHVSTTMSPSERMWLDQLLKATLPKQTLAHALRTMIDHWARSHGYLSHPTLPNRYYRRDALHRHDLKTNDPV